MTQLYFCIQYSYTGLYEHHIAALVFYNKLWAPRFGLYWINYPKIVRIQNDVMIIIDVVRVQTCVCVRACVPMCIYRHMCVYIHTQAWDVERLHS
jgi:hypothetical protein